MLGFEVVSEEMQQKKKKDAVLVLRKLNGQCEAQHPMTRRLP